MCAHFRALKKDFTLFVKPVIVCAHNHLQISTAKVIILFKNQNFSLIIFYKLGLNFRIKKIFAIFTLLKVCTLKILLQQLQIFAQSSLQPISFSPLLLRICKCQFRLTSMQSVCLYWRFLLLNLG